MTRTLRTFRRWARADKAAFDRATYLLAFTGAGPAALGADPILARLNSRLARLWHNLPDAARAAVRNPGE
jgi:hypothetical protein